MLLFEYTGDLLSSASRPYSIMVDCFGDYNNSLPLFSSVLLVGNGNPLPFPGITKRFPLAC